MTITVTKYSHDQEKDWNRILDSGNGSTLFHDLNFLAYHGNRFKNNLHHLIFFKGETPFGIMPLALFEEGGLLVGKSPYGASYGGPIFNNLMGYSESMKVVSALVDYFQSQKIKKCRITFPICICYQQFSQTFLLALLEHGFTCINRDISNAVVLHDSLVEDMDKRARNMARKALKNNVKIVKNGDLNDFWDVLIKTYHKLGKNPTHSIEEFKWLITRFPGRIFVDIAYLENQPIAGIGHFGINSRVDSSFYLCQDPEKQYLQGLSLLIFETIQYSKEKGYQWFDFGTSSVNMIGRENLFSFKESFGAVGFFRETYEWCNL